MLYKILAWFNNDRDKDKLDHYKAKLKKAMEIEGFPAEQFERLGVK